MAGSNAVSGPVAVLAAVTTALATASVEGGQVQVSYAWPGNEAERECVYGGHIGGSHDDYAMRGGGRRPRQERLTWTLYLRVVRPDLSSVECAQRALTLGASIEEAIAAAAVHSGAGVDGMKAIGVSGFELQNFADDDSRGAEIKYSVEFLSVIA